MDHGTEVLEPETQDHIIRNYTVASLMFIISDSFTCLYCTQCTVTGHGRCYERLTVLFRQGPSTAM